MAFNAVLVVDGGRTAYVQYGRTAEKIRGTGIYRELLHRQFPEIIYPKFPSIARIRSTVITTAVFDRNEGSTVNTTRVQLQCYFVTGWLFV